MEASQLWRRVSFAVGCRQLPTVSNVQPERERERDRQRERERESEREREREGGREHL